MAGTDVAGMSTNGRMASTSATDGIIPVAHGTERPDGATKSEWREDGREDGVTETKDNNQIPNRVK